MQCAVCRSENVQRARYCSECGEPLPLACERCRAELLPGAKHCVHCGLRISKPSGQLGERPATAVATNAAAARPAAGRPAERRQLTVLFCDMVDSTGLARALGDKYHSVLRAYMAAAEVVVRSFEGHVAQRLGDGLLVYFGIPHAHEDDPQRGVRGGLGILKALQRLSANVEREYNVRLLTRIGIDTGLVVTGEIGEGDRVERLAFGETPNLAARLKDIAEPDTLVISESTRCLVEGYFAIRDLGPRELKGVGRVAAVYEVLHEGTARSRLDAVGPAGLTPLAGRQEEVEILRDRWDRVKREGRGHVVMLCGEAGIGKSRLTRVLEEYVAEDPGNWLTRCTASPYYQNTAFFPVVDFLERVALRFAPDDDSERKRRKLEEWLVSYGLALDETLPLFIRLLSLPAEGTRPAAALTSSPMPANAGGHDPRVEKQKTMELLLRILCARAAEQPLLFVCEDLHWADPSTLELLSRLIDNVVDVRILVALTFRPHFHPPAIPEGHGTELALTRLGPVPSTQIATVALGGKPLPRSLLEQILARTDGNPLFIEELCQMVEESGLLREVDGRHELVRPIPTLAIPATLRDSLTARLDHLAGARDVAQLCAVLGREFPYELLAAVSRLDDDALCAALDQIVQSELLYQSGVPPYSRYVFKHALIQEASYDAMLLERRQKLHRWVAIVLRRRFRDVAARQPELIARHYAESDRRGLSVGFWTRAGRHALERAANAEAIAHLEQGLRVLQEVVPPGPTRDRRELEIQHGLAPAYMAIKGWAAVEVERACGRALELSDPRGNFGSLWGLWTNQFLRARLQESLETGLHVLELAASVTRTVPPGLRASAHTNLEVMGRHAVAYSHFYLGHFKETRSHAETALSLQCIGESGAFNLDAEREIVRDFQFSSCAALRMMLGSSMWMLGYLDQAPALVDSAIALTRELKHSPSEAFALGTSLLFHHYRLDLTRAAATADELQALAQREGFEIWGPIARMFRGWVATENGFYEDGINETREGRRLFVATGSVLNQTIVSAILARSLRKAGRLDEALETLDIDLAEAYERRELNFAPELHRLKGEILLDRERDHEGEVCLEQAAALAREQHARTLELRATAALARLWQRTGRAALANHTLSHVYHQFTEGFSQPELTAAGRLLETLQRVAAPPERVGGPGVPSQGNELGGT